MTKAVITSHTGNTASTPFRGGSMAKTVLRLLLAMMIFPLLHAVPAQAQATRTFVSGRGSDTNPCSVTAPCNTFQAALAQTVPGGEIYVLNSANYGPVTITQSISITSEGKAAGVLATSGGTGITINAGANDVINLRGLDIDGAGSGASGIVFNTGATLNIQNCVIRGFTNFGINFAPTASSDLFVSNTLVSNNTATGIIYQLLGSGTGTGALSQIEVVSNGNGISVLNSSNMGSVNVTIDSSVVANNSAVGVLSQGLSTVMIVDSTIANNGVGLEAQNTGAVLQVAQSTLTGNVTGWQVANTGHVISSSNNSIGGNTTGNSAPPTTIATAPTPTPVPTSYLLDTTGTYLLNSSGTRLTAS